MKLKQYIFSQISITFLPIFFGLFFITSIIFLVRIAALTSVITMNVFELLTLYVYVIPNILFFTLPISFFLSLVISFSKLSGEYELIVITSFGLNPLRILKIIFPITLILSITMLIVSLGLIPKTKHLTNTMLEQKKKEANFNIKESEFGQKFGDWLIYITEKKDKVYSDVKLFKTNNRTDQFIISETAKLNNEDGDLSFVLKDGKSFAIEEKELNQIDFKTMRIGDSLTNAKLESFTNSMDFWIEKINKKEDVDKFTFYILTSLFPVLSLLLVISFGYFNPRYEKNRAAAFSIFCVVIYYVGADYLSKHIFLNAIYIVPIVWLVMTYFVYAKKIKEIY